MLQTLLVDIDVDLIFESATDLDRGHPGGGFQALAQFVVGEAAQLLEFCLAGGRAAAGEGQAHDRVGRRIEAQQYGFFRFQRQLQHIELVAHVEAGLIHIRAPGKLEDHIGLAGLRHRVDLAHVLDHAKRFLDRLRNQRLDFQRCGTFEGGAHGQRRIAQVRQQVDLEAEQPDHAEQHQGQRDHADGHAPAGGQFDQAHALLSSTKTEVPSRTALRPTVITRVPSSRPERISTLSPSL